MKKYETDILDIKQIEALGANLKDGNNYITETAGFIPLEVKLKQFEQNGLIAQFQVGDFTSSDYRDIYLNPDFAISPEDDLEDIQEKIEARNIYVEQLKKTKSNGLNAKAGTEEPEKKAAKAANTSAAKEQRDGIESAV